MISNCGSDERGKLSGGKAGDQTGKEYCVRTWYNRPWKCVLRHPNAKVQAKLATVAKAAANNNKVGYDQGQRLTYYAELKAANWKPKLIEISCEADCSASTAANVIAVGHRLGLDKLKKVNPSCTTANLRSALKAAGFEVLTDSKYLTSDNYLLSGDVLLNDGVHVAINLDKGSKVSSASNAGSTSSNTSKKKVNPYKEPSGTIEKGDEGEGVMWVQFELRQAGYTEVKVDGKAGSITDKYIRKFQQSCKIMEDGVVGSVTRKKLLSK